MDGWAEGSEHSKTEKSGESGPVLLFPSDQDVPGDVALGVLNNHFLPCFGTAYAGLSVSSNGRVLWDAYSQIGAFSPYASVPSPMSLNVERPSIGCWSDLDPSAGGAITISSPDVNTVRVDYDLVPYYGAPATERADFRIEFDTLTGSVSILGLNGITASAGNPWPLVIGLFRGDLDLFPTDPGETNFTVGGPNVPSSIYDMIYTAGAVQADVVADIAAAGLTGIRFDPILSGPLCGAYSWTGF